MKVKTFHALLLSAVMIAGAVTINDAFAQTNTERLSTVVDTTSDTNQRVVQLTEVWNNFGSQFTPITDALNMVAVEITAMSDDISDLSDDVMATSAKVDTLEDKLDKYTTTRTSDSAELKAQIDNLMETLPDIQNRISTLAGGASVGDLADKVDAITAQLNEFSSALATIQTEVESIQGELGIVKETTVTVTGESPDELSPHEFTGEVKLAWYAHRLTEPPVDNVYTANYNFVCQSDVFITSLSSDIGVGKLQSGSGNQADIRVLPAGNFLYGTNGITFKYTNSTGHIFTSENKVINPVFAQIIHDQDVVLKAGDTLIFDNNFRLASGSSAYGVEINRSTGDATKEVPVTFTNPMELKAGEPLVFESTTDLGPTETDATRYLTVVNGSALYKYANTKLNNDIATDIGDSTTTGGVGAIVHTHTGNTATKAQLGDATVYEVVIKYHSVSTDPQCKLTPAYIAPLDNTDQVTFVSPEISSDSSDGILTEYKTSLDCDLNAVRITDVTADLTGATGFNNYVNMNLKIGDDTKAEFTFANNTSILNEKYSYPIEFEAVDLTIEGDALVGSGLVIQFTYDTITGGACSGQEP